MLFRGYRSVTVAAQKALQTQSEARVSKRLADRTDSCAPFTVAALRSRAYGQAVMQEANFSVIGAVT
jgi:hypothetical protein